MKELASAILGDYTFSVWIGTIFWTTVILFTYKLFKAPNKENGFKWSYFWRYNSLNFLFHILLSAIVLRAGEGLIGTAYSVINKYVLSKFETEIDHLSMDVIMMVAIIVLPLSFLMHKYLKKQEPK